MEEEKTEPPWLDQKVNLVLQHRKEGHSLNSRGFRAITRVSPPKFRLPAVSSDTIEIRQVFIIWKVSFPVTRTIKRGLNLRNTLYRCWQKHMEAPRPQ